MQLEVQFMPVVLLKATEAWAVLDNPERLRWLESKLATLTEFQMQPNGVFWVDGKADNAGDMLMMLWNLIDNESINALRRIMSEADVVRYFLVSVHGGAIATDQETIFAPFLRG